MDLESEANDQKPDPFESVTENSTTAEEFLQKLDLASDRWHEDSFWIFRGQNDACWELEPSLFRTWDDDTSPIHEIELIRNFIRVANIANLPIPPNSLGYSSKLTNETANSATQRRLSKESGLQDGVFYDFAHVAFAIAQHSGVPTRLLDFTYDPYIAAYFAADWTSLLNNLEISPAHLGEYYSEIFKRYSDSLEDGRRAWKDYSDRVKSRLDELPGFMAVWAVRASDLEDTSLHLLDHPYGEILNLSAQKGVFLCETENYELRGVPWRSFNGKLSALVETGGIYKFTLPTNERESLIDRLGRRRISPLFMQPTYKRVAEAVVANRTKSK